MDLGIEQAPTILSRRCFALYRSQKLRQAALIPFSIGACSMPRSIYLAAFLAVVAIFAIQTSPRFAAASTPKAAPANPEFTADSKLVRPEGYRKWVFLSSGYGMSYSQKASDDQDHLMFTNVFVPPADYDYFLAHGTWPEKTM